MDINKLNKLRNKINSKSKLSEIIEYIELITKLTVKDYQVKYDGFKNDDDVYGMFRMKNARNVSNSILTQLLSDLETFNKK